MATLPIDMSGKGGLTPRFWGDIDRTIVTPNLRYIGNQDQMADGLYNPFRRYGYLSPANATFNGVTDGSTENFTNIMTCSIYDPINDDYYFGRYGIGLIYKGDGLDDISLATQTYPGTGELFDLEIYQVNAVRKLFYVSRVTAALSLTTTLGASVAWMYGGTWVQASTSGVVPTLNTSARETSANATTVTKSITVAAGAGRVLCVVAANYTATAATSATWGGNALTVHGTQTVGAKSFTTFYTTSGFGTEATSTAANVVVTWPSAQDNLVVSIFVFQGANTTAPLPHALDVGSGTSDTATVMTSVPQYLNMLSFGTVISATQTHTQAVTQTEVFNSANTVGTDSSSYRTATTANLQVGIASLPFSSQNTSWLTGTVTGAFTNTVTGHAFMEVADNGFAYLFQDNVVHKIDGTASGGTNGTISPNVITFPAYFRIVDAVDYRGLMFIAIHQYSSDIRSFDDPIDSNTLKCGVYLWDRLSTVINTRDYIPMEGVKQIRKIYVAPSGNLRAIVINSERVTEIREYDGAVFKVIEEVGYNAYPQLRDSLTTFNKVTTWLGRNGLIYAHGKITPGDSEALYKIGYITDVSTTALSTGAILFGGEDTGSTSAGFKTQKQGLFLSYYNGTNWKVKEWDIYGTGSTGSTSVSKLQQQGDVYTLVKYLPQMSTVKDIEIFMYPGTGSGSTTAGTVKIYFNQSSTAWASKVITQAQSATGYVRIEVNKPFVNSIQLEVEFNTSAVVGVLDFSPSMAVIEYEPSGAKG